MATKAIIGRKLGMTQIFTEDGRLTPATVIQAGPCPVVAVRTGDSDGYDAVQLAFEPVPARKISKPEIGHLAKVDVEPHRHLKEFRGGHSAVVGDTVTVSEFEPGDAIKVTGTSKGKGFAGTIKRHNFASGPKSHGSHNVRAPGSIGASATPSRVFKGIRGPGRMGGGRVTQRGLTIVELIADQNLMLVRGAVPGPKGTTVEVRTDG
jgi:large subunit ribosomal protein L3